MAIGPGAADHGDGIPGEQYNQDRQGGGGCLHREVTGTPDDRNKEKYQVGIDGRGFGVVAWRGARFPMARQVSDALGT